MTIVFFVTLSPIFDNCPLIDPGSLILELLRILIFHAFIITGNCKKRLENWELQTRLFLELIIVIY